MIFSQIEKTTELSRRERFVKAYMPPYTEPIKNFLSIFILFDLTTRKALNVQVYEALKILKKSP